MTALGWRARAGMLGAVLLVSGCGGGQASSTPPPSSAAATATSEPTCSDSDDARLKSVTLTDAGESLTVQWQTQNLSSSAKTTLWAVMVTGADGGIYQVAVKQIGTRAQSWVFDFGTAAQEEVSAPGAVPVTPAGVSESFPYSDMPDLGATFEWKATLNIDGQDVAFCPSLSTCNETPSSGEV
jgi:hypothetical protein